MRAWTLIVILAVGGLATESVSPHQQSFPTVQDPQVIRLWPEAAPGALGDRDEDTPTISVHLPSKPTGTVAAVIVAPGGSYRALSMIKEGREPHQAVGYLPDGTMIVINHARSLIGKTVKIVVSSMLQTRHLAE